MVVVDRRVRWWSLLLVEIAGGIDVVGKDNWMIDVPVVLYFGLTGGVSVVSNVDASPRSESFVD